MDPFTIMMLGSAVVQGGASIYNGHLQYDAYKQQEQQVLQTAIRNRDAVLAQGNVEAEQLQLRNRFRNAIGVNQIAASGINDSGSASEVQSQNEYFGELDVYRTRQNAQIQANNYVYNALNQVDYLQKQMNLNPMNTGINVLGIAASTAGKYAVNGKYNQLNLNSMNAMSVMEQQRQTGINTRNSATGIGNPYYEPTPAGISTSYTPNLLNNDLYA